MRFILLFLLILSCSKKEQDKSQDFLLLLDEKSQSPVVSVETESKPSTVLPVLESEFAAITSFPETSNIEKKIEFVNVKNTSTENNSTKKLDIEPKVKDKIEIKTVEQKTYSSAKKTEVKQQEPQKAKSKELPATKSTDKKETFVFDDKYYPQTRDDARNYAYECYKKAKAMTNLDSVRIICQKGLSIYENSSLYYLFAKGLSSAGNYSSASNNCKTALSRDDFWGDEINETVKLLVDCLQKTYEKSPSNMLLSQIEKYKEMIR
jgi:hypothetical protein